MTTFTAPDDVTVNEDPEPEAEPEAEPETDDADEEEAEADEEAPAESEPEPAALQAVTPEQYEERAKKSGQAWLAYTKKISAIFEEDATDLILCPLCPDMHKGFLNVHDAGRVPDDIKDAAMLFLGIRREQDYESNPDTYQCDACKGKGRLENPTTVAEYQFETCTRCGGRGYIRTGQTPQNGAVHVDAPPVLAEVPSVPVASGDRDLWGEPRILPDGRPNPNHGKYPDHKIEVPPWGKTAGLTALDEQTS